MSASTDIKQYINDSIGGDYLFTNGAWSYFINDIDVKFVKSLKIKYDGYHRGRGMHIVSQLSASDEKRLNLLYEKSLPLLSQVPDDIKSINITRKVHPLVFIQDTKSRLQYEKALIFQGQDLVDIFSNRECFEDALFRAFILNRLCIKLNFDRAVFTGDWSVLLSDQRIMTLDYHDNHFVLRLSGSDWTWPSIFAAKNAFQDVLKIFSCSLDPAFGVGISI